jgi:hypothetical protein
VKDHERRADENLAGHPNPNARCPTDASSSDARRTGIRRPRFRIRRGCVSRRRGSRQAPASQADLAAEDKGRACPRPSLIWLDPSTTSLSVSFVLLCFEVLRQVKTTSEHEALRRLIRLICAGWVPQDLIRRRLPLSCGGNTLRVTRSHREGRGFLFFRSRDRSLTSPADDCVIASTL